MQNVSSLVMVSDPVGGCEQFHNDSVDFVGSHGVECDGKVETGKGEEVCITK